MTLDFSSKSSLPVILQTEGAECGLACLAMIAAFHGHQRDIASLRRQHYVGLQGLSLRGLTEIADKMGFSPRPLRAEISALSELKLPCILHWDMSHFVVLERVRGMKLTIVDPAKGREVISLADASPHFTGVALELTPSERFEKLKDVKRVRIRDLWQRMVGLKRSIVQLLLLTFLLQAFGLLSPLFSQLVIDEAIVKGDANFLVMLTIGFLLVMVIQLAIGIVRSYVSLYLTNSMTFQMQVNLFRHLTRLPADFFKKRHIGDIQSRFGSLMPIEQMLTGTLVGVLLDGIMCITTVVVIFIYSWQLSLMVIGLLVLNLIGTLLIFPTFRAMSEKQIQAGAKEQTAFLEIIRGLPTIKTFGRESEREGVWKNTLADEINTGIRLTRFGIWTGGGQGLVNGIGEIGIFAVGALFVINGQFTLGMLVAFQSYQGQFVEAANKLIDALFEIKMIGLHLERLADIVHAEPEESVPEGSEAAQPLKGKIELEKVSYRYGSTMPFVFEDMNMTIDTGDCVIISGRSGAGKSTMISLITGLLKPTSGVVRIDGQPMAAFGLQRLRRNIGVVSQDDTLLSGTLAENISFFDPEIDRDRVTRCTETVMIHDDITTMPMQYDTLVGDMGSSLSGGQRQRILLARALYNEPRILILDEGMAHIDEATAESIIEKIGALNITRIIISHNSHTLAALGQNHRQYYLNGGILLSPEAFEALATAHGDQEEDAMTEDNGIEEGKDAALSA